MEAIMSHIWFGMVMVWTNICLIRLSTFLRSQVRAHRRWVPSPCERPTIYFYNFQAADGHTFNIPDKKFLDVEGTEFQVFGQEGKAADVQGYESDDGPSSGDEVDEDSRGYFCD